VAVSSDGWLVTSLYNLTNVAPIVDPLWRPPDGSGFEAGLAAVERVTALVRGTKGVPARIVAHDSRIGVALLKAELPQGVRIPLFEPAPADSYRAGRFVLAVGNPFGSEPNPDPLLAFGILSKRHADDAFAPWRGQWQSDLGATDSNCGGAVVDLEGRLVGMLTIWSGVEHGRNSGVSFVVPWGRIQRALPDLRAGRTPRRGLLGAKFVPGAPARIGDVVAGGAADRAGLAAGDVVVALDRSEIGTTVEALSLLGHRWAGDTVALRIARGGTTTTFRVRLDATR
jgi:S1-C subfamily serine protease